MNFQKKEVVEKQKPMPLIYREIRLEAGFRVDLLVEKQVIVEIKSVDLLNDVHLAQTLTYMKLSDCKLGFLVNVKFDVFKLWRSKVWIN